MVAERVKSIGITHILSSDLGRTQKTAEIIAQVCHCNIILEPHLRELNKGILERRAIGTLSDEEECWRRSLVNGSPGARIPAGESMGEITEHMFAALEHCCSLPAGEYTLLVSHGIGLGALLNRILGVPTYAERHLRLRNCSISQVDYQETPWLANGWVVEIAGDISYLIEPALDEQ